FAMLYIIVRRDLFDLPVQMELFLYSFIFDVILFKIGLGITIISGIFIGARSTSKAQRLEFPLFFLFTHVKIEQYKSYIISLIVILLFEIIVLILKFIE
ncbi:MAG: hypothetical protein ABIJ12_09500, partial [bacterium]